MKPWKQIGQRNGGWNEANRTVQIEGRKLGQKSENRWQAEREKHFKGADNGRVRK
jgi:hypothetical protein